eukprot:TRINITY_DN2823_c0_g1_i1.p1 TRINITY_DN2823_c0_g1~~TRINITY_DN2823_c0_g1_i1.p1  ORF type:complete len:530 (-),score=118.93 TRINITY_DN2823_c0_g1_i1:38-1627(-)
MLDQRLRSGCVADSGCFGARHCGGRKLWWIFCPSALQAGNTQIKVAPASPLLLRLNPPPPASEMALLILACLGAVAAETFGQAWLCHGAVALDPTEATLHTLPDSAYSVAVRAQPGPAPGGAALCTLLAQPAGHEHVILRGDPGAISRVAALDGVRLVLVPDRPGVAIATASSEVLGAAGALLRRVDAQAARFVAPHSLRPGLRSAKAAKAGQKAQSKSEVVAAVRALQDEFGLQMEYLTGVTGFMLDGNMVTTSTRYTHTLQNLQSAQMIRQYLGQFYSEVFFQNFTYAGQVTRNVIAIKPGRTDEVVVVGAHFDSTSQSPQTDAPGCVDNGSGTDGVMMLAKAFANVETERTIHFVAFNAEEQGLYGSQHYVNKLAANGYNVHSALIMDMIGYSAQYYGVTLEGLSEKSTKALMELAASNTAALSPSLQIHKRYQSWGSDHVPFQQAGIPCFLWIEMDDVEYPGYHDVTDEMVYLSVEQSIDILAALAGTLWDLSMGSSLDGAAAVAGPAPMITVLMAATAALLMML